MKIILKFQYLISFIKLIQKFQLMFRLYVLPYPSYLYIYIYINVCMQIPVLPRVTNRLNLEEIPVNIYSVCVCVYICNYSVLTHRYYCSCATFDQHIYNKHNRNISNNWCRSLYKKIKSSLRQLNNKTFSSAWYSISDWVCNARANNGKFLTTKQSIFVYIYIYAVEFAIIIIQVVSKIGWPTVFFQL